MAFVVALRAEEIKELSLKTIQPRPQPEEESAAKVAVLPRTNAREITVNDFFRIFIGHLHVSL